MATKNVDLVHEWAQTPMQGTARMKEVRKTEEECKKRDESKEE